MEKLFWTCYVVGLIAFFILALFSIFKGWLSIVFLAMATLSLAILNGFGESSTVGFLIPKVVFFVIGVYLVYYFFSEKAKLWG